MTKPTAVRLASLVAFGFCVQSFAASIDTPPIDPGEKDRTKRPAVEAPDARRYACPAREYIDCMPPIGKSNRDLCTREYLEWAKSHCPGVKVVY
jgi:hypothetical protein